MLLWWEALKLSSNSKELYQDEMNQNSHVNKILEKLGYVIIQYEKLFTLRKENIS